MGSISNNNNSTIIYRTSRGKPIYSNKKKTSLPVPNKGKTTHPIPSVKNNADPIAVINPTIIDIPPPEIKKSASIVNSPKTISEAPSPTIKQLPINLPVPKPKKKPILNPTIKFTPPGLEEKPIKLTVPSPKKRIVLKPINQISLNTMPVPKPIRKAIPEPILEPITPIINEAPTKLSVPQPKKRQRPPATTDTLLVPLVAPSPFKRPQKKLFIGPLLLDIEKPKIEMSVPQPKQKSKLTIEDTEKNLKQPEIKLVVPIPKKKKKTIVHVDSQKQEPPQQKIVKQEPILIPQNVKVEEVATVKPIRYTPYSNISPSNPINFVIEEEAAIFERTFFSKATQMKEVAFSTINQIIGYAKSQINLNLSPKKKLAKLHTIIRNQLSLDYETRILLINGLNSTPPKLDCDTGSFVYLAVAHELGWPVQITVFPGHAFARWVNDDGTYFNWETTSNLNMELSNSWYSGMVSPDFFLQYMPHTHLDNTIALKASHNIRNKLITMGILNSHGGPAEKDSPWWKKLLVIKKKVVDEKSTLSVKIHPKMIDLGLGLSKKENRVIVRTIQQAYRRSLYPDSFPRRKILMKNSLFAIEHNAPPTFVTVDAKTNVEDLRDLVRSNISYYHQSKKEYNSAIKAVKKIKNPYHAGHHPYYSLDERIENLKKKAPFSELPSIKDLFLNK